MWRLDQGNIKGYENSNGDSENVEKGEQENVSVTIISIVKVH